MVNKLTCLRINRIKYIACAPDVYECVVRMFDLIDLHHCNRLYMRATIVASENLKPKLGKVYVGKQLLSEGDSR